MTVLISFAGKADSARGYLRSPPISAFQTVQHDEFLRWIDARDKPLTHISPPSISNLHVQLSQRPHFPRDQASVVPITLTREHSPTDDSAQLSSLSHRPKRIRTAAKEKPPCLRCKVLKKKVSCATNIL
jgi:hypothetical protein